MCKILVLDHQSKHAQRLAKCLIGSQIWGEEKDSYLIAVTDHHFIISQNGDLLKQYRITIREYEFDFDPRPCIGEIVQVKVKFSDCDTETSEPILFGERYDNIMNIKIDLNFYKNANIVGITVV